MANTATVDLIINQGNAIKRVGELRDELDKLRKTKRDALAAGDNELSKSISAEIKVIGKDMKALTTQSVDVEKVLQKINKVPLSTLQTSQRKLRAELQGLDRDSLKYHDTQQKLVRIENELNSTRKTSISTLGKLSMFAAGGLGARAMVNYAERAVTAYAQLDDKIADVMKTTGLSKEQVKDLDAELLKLETRTTRIQLLDLARVGGKLGIGDPAELEGFVRAADKIKVALAEDLGGDVEGAIGQLGKLVDIFKLKPEMGLEGALMSVGSAINALGAASTANEGYLVDFTARAAGVAPAIGVSISNVLGLGATLDSLGQTAEVSGTVYSQVMTKMQTDTAKYAKLAGMDVAAFTKLFNEDANEAFLKFLEGVGQGGNVAKKLSGLGLEGARATQVLGALAMNTERVREQQALADIEFVKATSIINEYNTKNESAQAILEKRKKVLDTVIQDMGERLMPLWSNYIGLQGNMLRGLMAVTDVLWKYRGVLLSVGIAVGANIGLRKAKIAIQQLEVFWSTTNRTALASETIALTGATTKTYLLATAKNVLAGNFRVAATAAKAFMTSLGAIGWISIAIGAIGTAIAALSSRTSDFAKSQKDIVQINNNATDSYAKEKVELEQLLAVASDKSASDKERQRAMEELQLKLPNGIELINEETIANGKAKKAVDDYCESLLRRAKVEAAKDYLVELEKERLKAIEEGADSQLTVWQKVKLSFVQQSGAYAAMATRYMEENASDYEKSTIARYKRITDYIQGLKLDPSPQTSPSPKDDPIPFDSSKSKTKWSLSNDEAFMKAKLKLRDQLFNEEIASEEDYDKQLLSLEISTLEQRIAMRKESGATLLDLQGQLAEKQYQQVKEERSRTDKLIAASLEGGASDDLEQQFAKEKLDYEKRLRDLGIFGVSREEMTQLQLSALLNQERIHNLKLQGIYTSSLTERFKQSTKETERLINNLKIAHNQELADAKSFEQKKELVAKYYDTERAARLRSEREADKLIRGHYNSVEEAETKEHLEKLLVEYTTLMSQLTTGAMVGDIPIQFNEEEVAKLQAIIDKLKADLAALRGGDSVDSAPIDNGVDILGFSGSDWETFFANLENGKMGIKDWKMALDVVAGAFASINNLMAAAENRELKEYEKTAKAKKKRLDEQKKYGLITEENYQQQVQDIDAQTEEKKAEVERKQAARAKALSIFEAMVNTAVGITSALKAGPIAGPILAAVIGALGAVQIAAIAATPLPGLEEGGQIDVVRQQDGKHFSASNDPTKRGYVDKPTVIVGEDGREYIVPDEGANNPTIAPVLDIIERSRRNGTLSSINLPAVMGATIPGYASGGAISGSVSGNNSIVDETPDNDDVSGEQQGVRRLLEMLISILSNGIDARVVMLGRGGLVEQLEKYNSTVAKSRK